MLKGISRRWFVNTIGLVLLILVAFISIFSYTIRTYSYNSMNQILRSRMDEFFNVTSYSGEFQTSSDFLSIARNYVEGFPDRDMMEIMLLDPSGRIVITSTGFEPDHDQEMQDYLLALVSEDGYGSYTGELATGERIMALTRTVRNPEGRLFGSIRYVVSMENADRQSQTFTIALIAIGIIIMLFIFSAGLYFIRSIIIPIRQLTATAKEIPQGHFDVRIEKKKDDEIGQLCDAINDMAAELAATDRMKNDFISSVSHELRTPLTSIKGWAETINTGVDADTAHKGMGVIIRESERLSGIVEELLDFSRLQSARMKMNLAKTDILADLEEVVYMFTDRAETEKKTLDYQETETLSPILGDNDRLKQVFVNIVDNAIKYTPEGGRIAVSSFESDGYVRIVIADNGCGIPAAHLPNIKKKFYKANQIVRGSGIGLAVADEIVRLHFGSIDIDSAEGAGTTVTISVPTIQTVEAHPEWLEEGADSD